MKKEGMVTLKSLQEHLWTLVTLEEARAPLVSCYLNLEGGYADVLSEKLRLLTKNLDGIERSELDEAVSRIERFIRVDSVPGEKGAAAFARGGDAPFFLGLRFQAPLPDLVAVDSQPRVYPLVELKDACHRYVVMLATHKSIRILEVDLGAVTEQIWKERPELRRRVGREWTKEHYGNHRRERMRLFVKDAVKTLTDVILAGGYEHFILAGEPKVTALVKRTLPKHLACDSRPKNDASPGRRVTRRSTRQKPAGRLAARLIGSISASGSETLPELVAATSLRFRVQEALESQAMVENLQQELRSDGLAVAGTGDCFEALKRGQVRALVIAAAYAAGPGWCCSKCSLTWVQEGEPDSCPKCGNRVRRLDLKEEIVRMAERNRCQVETVAESNDLMQLGGVGCLLRYRGAHQRALGKTA